MIRAGVQILLTIAYGIASGHAHASAAAKTGAPRVIDLGDGIKLELVWINSGDFLMGSADSEKSRGAMKRNDAWP